jgi:16S rRNA (cytidine1402-2'-O)-methyltransferase
MHNMTVTRINTTSSSTGSLYIVATPIGNLGDMVPRALEILQSVNVIVAEDTRHSKKLLQHFGITTALLSFHDHSSTKEAENILKRLVAGDSVAMISDAGTPLISDPGYQLVTLAHQRQVPVIPVPGPCAATVALSASGLPTDRFWFEGFLPAKSTARKQRLIELLPLQATLVFYEAPHRVVELFADMAEVFGAERHCCMARELTKQFETIRKGSIDEIKKFIESDTNQQRGEFVILVATQDKQANRELDDESERVLDVLLEELSVKQAAALAAKITGKPKRVLYDKALEKKHD